MLLWDHLTEASITDIAVSPVRKSVTLSVLGNSGEKWIIEAHDVDDFLTRDFRLSNIIDQINLVETSDEITSDVMEIIYFLMRGSQPKPEDLDWDPLKRKIEHIKSGILRLFEIESVYGARVLILAGNVTLTQSS